MWQVIKQTYLLESLKSQKPKHFIYNGFFSLLLLVQNGAVTQKDTLNDDEFEPYLNTQARQVSICPLCESCCTSSIIHIY